MGFNELEDIKLRLTALEHKLAASEAERKKLENDTCDFIEKSGEQYRELYALAFAAYCKTHPEYGNSMDQYHKIVEKKTDEPGGEKS